jgi:hypothetical protein
MTWIYPDSQPGRYAVESVLDYDQLLLHVGMDAAKPQQLGAVVEFYLGGQPIIFNTTTSVFIPKGTAYGPIRWREVGRPFVQLCWVLGSGDPPAARPPLNTTGGVGGAAPVRRDVGAGTAPVAGLDVDYEQYVIRSPMREAGPEHVEGRQNPTMTYLSRNQIPSVDAYLEFGWIWDVPQPTIPKMRHDDFDEIVLHIGSDPGHPEDLGGVLEFGIGEDLLEFDTTHCAFIPRGLDHGPLPWKQVRRPLIEMAIMVGAGTYAEGWANSFFDLPDGERRGPI